MEAKTRGHRVVHIDPRFTRTSALADRHVPLRAGSDIAFLGGVINYILSNELDFREYVTAYTNASFLVDETLPPTPRTSTGCSAATTTPPRRTTRRRGSTRAPTPEHGGAEAKEEQHRLRVRLGRAADRRGRRRDPAATRRCSTRAASTRSSSGTTPATPRRWSSGCAASRRAVPRRGAEVDAELRAGRRPPRWCTASAGPSTRRRPVHPRRRDHPAAAGQHRPSRRRGVRAARARQHPGLDRRARRCSTCCPATWRCPRPGRTPPGRLPRRHHRPQPEGVLAQRRHATWSRCSRSTGASTRPPRTTTASTTCRASTATTAPTAP